jgi:metal-responsive CopG/Arc/MetJ family transcriptional regulator
MAETEKRISIKLTKDTEWLFKALDDEQKEQTRPSRNNMVIHILKEYFKKKNERRITENMNIEKLIKKL